MEKDCFYCKYRMEPSNGLCNDCRKLAGDSHIYTNFTKPEDPEFNEKPVDAPMSSLTDLYGSLLDSIKEAMEAVERLKKYYCDNWDKPAKIPYTDILRIDNLLEEAEDIAENKYGEE